MASWSSWLAAWLLTVSMQIGPPHAAPAFSQQLATGHQAPDLSWILLSLLRCARRLPRTCAHRQGVLSQRTAARLPDHLPGTGILQIRHAVFAGLGVGGVTLTSTR